MLGLLLPGTKRATSASPLPNALLGPHAGALVPLRTMRVWWSGEPDTEYLDVTASRRDSVACGFRTQGHQKKKAWKPRRNLWQEEKGECQYGRGKFKRNSRT